MTEPSAESAFLNVSAAKVAVTTPMGRSAGAQQVADPGRPGDPHRRCQQVGVDVRGQAGEVLGVDDVHLLDAVHVEDLTVRRGADRAVLELQRDQRAVEERPALRDQLHVGELRRRQGGHGHDHVRGAVEVVRAPAAPGGAGLHRDGDRTVVGRGGQGHQAERRGGDGAAGAGAGGGATHQDRGVALALHHLQPVEGGTRSGVEDHVEVAVAGQRVRQDRVQRRGVHGARRRGEVDRRRRA